MHIGINFARVGIPFVKGAILSCESLAIFGSQNQRLSSSIKPTAYWSDGSVKWCLAKFAVAATQAGSVALKLTLDSEPVSSLQVPVIGLQENNDSIQIKDGDAEIGFDKNGSSFFPTVKVAGKTLWAAEKIRPSLIAVDGSACPIKVDKIYLADHDDLSCVCVSEGTVIFEDGVDLNIKFRFEVTPGAQLRCRCEIHNPARAVHSGGIWDLGDSGSVLFKDHSLEFALQETDRSALKAESEQSWVSADKPLSLFQASSGGNNWDSPVHVNAENKVCNKFRGYKLSGSNEVEHDGLRAEPILSVCSKEDIAYTVQLRDFWQNFPKSIDVENSLIHLRLFPMHHGDHYELQGGERKSHDIFFRFLKTDSINEVVNNQPLVRVSPEAYTESGVFRYFDHERLHAPTDRLLDVSLDDQRGFFAKREQLDEYGWRNHGEVYADHESAFHKGDDIFVSHYNNQYDSIGGFARQFALSGDQRWHCLMDDLAQHVMDIDIYRTDLDRSAYNNGLFWHTDHYAAACTASHRTFSALQINDSNLPSEGGGPGPHHCYSNGLMYYYYMTGDEEAKSSVLALGQWVRNYIEGSGTVIEAGIKLLREDAKKFKKICSREKIFRYTYPMDRGTGNYIRTLLDCYELSAEPKYLSDAENVIKNTAGPADDIDARGFDDIEGTWFYTIVLQDIARYLDVKRSMGSFDDSFHYARATLLHYARWAAANEHPYLSHPERLLYPNATWVAQDIRKTSLFYAAYKYALQDRAIFLEKARYFRDYVVTELSNEETLHYARIQILLLQNHGPSAHLEVESPPYPELNAIGISDKQSTHSAGCFHTPVSYLKDIGKAWFKCFSGFSLSGERQWLKTYLGR